MIHGMLSVQCNRPNMLSVCSHFAVKTMNTNGLVRFDQLVQSYNIITCSIVKIIRLYHLAFSCVILFSHKSTPKI